MGREGFFLSFRRGFVRLYPEVFKEADDARDGTNGGPKSISDSFHSKYGWLTWIDQLASGDKLKWDSVTRLSAGAFCLRIEYLIDEQRMHDHLSKS